MPLPPEYVELLTAVVDCLTADPQTPLHTAEDVDAWLHHLSVPDIRKALQGDSENPLLRGMVHCLIERTHHPLLTDWTPEQIADWCSRTRLGDIRAVLTQPHTPSSSDRDRPAAS